MPLPASSCTVVLLSAVAWPAGTTQILVADCLLDMSERLQAQMLTPARLSAAMTSGLELLNLGPLMHSRWSRCSRRPMLPWLG